MMHRRAAAALMAIAMAISLQALGADASGSAAEADQFNPGMIISDEVFYDGSSMSVSEIASFLNSRVGYCAASNGNPCLKDYRQDTTATPMLPNRCWSMAAQANQSAAEILFAVGLACSINPRVLIVLIEKEQGLVTSTAPSARMYRSATGYGCPDTAACDSTYYGFFNQVFNAARQFQSYRLWPEDWRHEVGRVNSVYRHPNAACGSASIYIENQATAGLYNYTPYTPNQAALENLYGIGDSCSSYGNRNFWRLYTDWFGHVFSLAAARQSINDLWAQLGGDQGKLGSPSSDVGCSASGCSQYFTGGAAYTPIGGTFAVVGGHAQKYREMGETGGDLGFPRSNELATGSGGTYALFQNGYSLWSPRTGVHAITGEHASKYGALGGSEGFLGYPITDVARTGSGGTFALYQGGVTIWSSWLGVHALDSSHGDAFQALGGSEGKVGYPTSDVRPTASGGTWVRYERGLSVAAAGRGAYVVPTGHAARYEQAGGSEGALGYPTSGEKSTISGGSYVEYEAGLSVWSPGTGVRVLTAGHASAYSAIGGSESKIGYPVSDERTDGRGGSWVRYQDGLSMSNADGSAYIVPGGHARSYEQFGGSAGALGSPRSGEVWVGDGGSFVQFDGGYSTWDRQGGLRVVSQAHAVAYAAAGGPGGKMGFPLSKELPAAAGGSYIAYEQGFTLWSPRTGAHAVPTGHAALYARLGGSDGWLGYPTATEVTIAGGGTMVTYQGGTAYWSPKTSVVALPSRYVEVFEQAQGPGGALGYPIAAPSPTAAGERAPFEMGFVDWTRSTNSFNVQITG